MEVPVIQISRHANAVFISDAHLGTPSPEDGRRTRELIRFLDAHDKSSGALIIVGDLFDFWFEYRYVIPREPFPVLHALRNVVDRGVEVHYLVGNHDFPARDFFQETIGIRIHSDPVDCRLNGRRFFIAHGDGLNPADRAYRWMKAVIRHPAATGAFRMLHPDLAFSLANALSNASRKHRPIKDRDQIYIDYAESRFADGYDYVILGHTHRPQEYHANERTYINTGDWMDQYTFGRYDDSGLHLHQWQLDQEPTQAS